MNQTIIIYIIVAIVALITLLLLLRLFLLKRNVKVKIADLPFNFSLLIDTLGGSDNIIDVTATHSKLKVFLVDQNLVKFDQLETFGISGIVQARDGITIIFGQISELVANEIIKYKKNSWKGIFLIKKPPFRRF